MSLRPLPLWACQGLRACANPLAPWTETVSSIAQHLSIHADFPAIRFGKTPSKRSVASTSVSSQDERFRKYYGLRLGLRNAADVSLALDLMSQHPRWKKLVDAMERLRQERIASGEIGVGSQEAFPIAVNKEGSFSARGTFKNRRTELSDSINIEDGSSILALVHELTHAIPIDRLPAELAQLPYEDAVDLEGDLSFEEIYHRLIRTPYQDESMSTLAEMLFFRDMKAMGVPVETLGSPEEIAELERYLEIYEREGIPGYLRSEVYIGRNHRSSYNHHRMVSLSLMASLQPKLLLDPSAQTVLGQFGVRLRASEAQGVDAEKLGALLQKIASWVQAPSVTGAMSLLPEIVAFFSESRLKLDLDAGAILEKFKEALALIRGSKKKASVDFTEERELNRHRVALLAETRKRFETYHRALGERLEKLRGEQAEQIVWQDYGPFIQFFRIAALLRGAGDPEGDKLVRQSLRDIWPLFRNRSGILDASLHDFFFSVLAFEFLTLADAPERLQKRAFRQVLRYVPLNSETASEYTKGRVDFYIGESEEKALDPAEFAEAEFFGKEKPDLALESIPKHLVARRALKEKDKEYDAIWRLWMEILQRPSKESRRVPQVYDGVRKWLSENNESIHRYLENYQFLQLPPETVLLKSQRNAVDLMQVLLGQAHQWKELVMETLSPRSDDKVEDVEHAKIDVTPERDGIFQAFFHVHALPKNFASMFPRWLKSVGGFGFSVDTKEGHDDQSTPIYRDMIQTFEFQNRWGSLRLGHASPEAVLRWVNAKPRSDQPEMLPIVYWFDAALAEWPDGWELFPKFAHPAGQGFLVNNYLPLRSSILNLEYARRGAEIPEGWEDRLSSELFPDSDEGFCLAELQTFWVYLHQALEWSRVFAARHHPEAGARLLAKAAEFLKRHLDAATEAIELSRLDRSMLRSKGSYDRIRAFVEDNVPLAIRLLPLFDAGSSLEEKQSMLRNFAEEYRGNQRSHRSLFSPSPIAAHLAPLTEIPELREDLLAIYRLAVDHAASFDADGEAFRHHSLTLLKIVDHSHFPHAEKETLIAYLVEQILPKPGSLLIISPKHFERHLQALRRLQASIFNEATLQRIALYPKAELVLLQRGQALLKDLGSFELPLEYQGEVLEVSFRLARMIQFVRPELMKFENSDALGRLSDDELYQQQLAEFFPSRQTHFDGDRPVLSWSSVAVRKGLPDDAQAWEKIQALLADLSSLDGQDAEKLLRIYDAFLLQQIEATGKPTVLAKEVDNFAQLAQKRQLAESSGEDHVQTRTALTLYAQTLRILSQREKTLLEDLGKIPALAWAQQMAEGIAREGRSWTDLEIRLWKTVLSAPTISDSVRKRELFLLVLANPSFPRELQREATLALAKGSTSRPMLESLVAGYAVDRQAQEETRFYAALARYWGHVGQIPSMPGLILIQEAIRSDEAEFWRCFDRVLAKRFSQPLTATEATLLVLQKGKLADRFVDDWEKYLQARPQARSSFLFHSEYLHFLPQDPARLETLKAQVRRARHDWLERRDRIEAVTKELPRVFLNLNPELRFLVQRFLHHYPSGTMGKILDELRKLGETATDIEVLSRFFVLTGLVKFGQQLARMLLGSIPEEDRAHLTRLEDGVPKSSYDEVVGFLEQELGVPWQRVFSSIGEEALASASMGEVWRATLKDGRKVVFKINPRSRFDQNNHAIAALEKTLQDYEREAARFHSPLNVESLLRQLVSEYRQQLDYSFERRNASQMPARYHAPVFIDEFEGVSLATPRLSVMEEIVGDKPTEVADPAERKAIAERYVGDALDMLLVQGFSHGDPHPGNTLWARAMQRLHWLDWPIVDRSFPQDREKLVRLLAAVIATDHDAIVEGLRQVLPKVGESRWAALRQGLEQAPIEGKAVRDRLIELLSRAGEHRIHLTMPLTKAVNFLLVVQSVTMELDPTRDFQQDVIRAYSRAVAEA